MTLRQTRGCALALVLVVACKPRERPVTRQVFATPPPVTATVAVMQPHEQPVLARSAALRRERDRDHVRVWVETLLEQTGELDVRCGSALGASAVGCDDASNARLTAFTTQLANALSIWDRLGRRTQNDPAPGRLLLTVHVTGMADSARVRRSGHYRERNRALVQSYREGVAAFGAPSDPPDPDDRGALNRIFACVRGYELLRRFQPVLAAAARSARVETGLRLECDAAAGRGESYRGARAQAEAILDVPRPLTEQTLTSFQAGGFQRRP